MATYRALLSLKSSLDDPDSRLSALRLLNVFNRTFPPELSNLTNLRVLDLYNNNLTGVLPVSVATFHSSTRCLACLDMKSPRLTLGLLLGREVTSPRLKALKFERHCCLAWEGRDGSLKTCFWGFQRSKG
ncbi:hypothetical protein ACLB2K_026557 [Fragaria x ananassa]